MKKTQKRFSLLVTLVCAFVLVLSLGIVSACGTGESASADGAWYFGAELPASELGQDGDYYLNAETLTSYVKEGKAWRAADPDEGGKWYYGTDALDGTETFGNTHDFYLDTDDGELYQKGADGWKSILVLKGKNGRDGVLWFSGKGVPENIKDSLVGDFYLNTEDFTVYQLTEEEGWKLLGTIKGDDGKDAKDPVQFFNSKGAPKDNETLLKDAKEGDLYLGKFDGFDTDFAGSILYRKIEGEWAPLMENVHKAQVNIESRGQLAILAEKVAEGATYEGKEIHLKVSIDFNQDESSRSRRVNGVAEGWTPIGTADHPFMGTFDGEGHTISNFSATGFFGHVKNATVKNLNFINVKAGSLVDTVVADSTVTVEQVKVEVADSVEHEEGSESNALVKNGEATFQGSNEVGYPVVAGVGGFVEMHQVNGEDVTIVYEVSTAAGLAAFRDDVNKKKEGSSSQANDYNGKDVYLMEDIDLNNEEWTPIGSYYDAWVQSSELYYCYFRGNFHGNGHTISNLKISEGEIKKGSS